MYTISRYFDALLPQLVPLQYNSYGGPILMVQVEDDTDTDAVSLGILTRRRKERKREEKRREE